MDTVCTSKACIAAAKLLYGETNESGVISLPQDWALTNPEQYLNFLTPENMTFAIAAEVGANSRKPSRVSRSEDLSRSLA